MQKYWPTLQAADSGDGLSLLQFLGMSKIAIVAAQAYWQRTGSDILETCFTNSG